MIFRTTTITHNETGITYVRRFPVTRVLTKAEEARVDFAMQLYNKPGVFSHQEMFDAIGRQIALLDLDPLSEAARWLVDTMQMRVYKKEADQ